MREAIQNYCRFGIVLSMAYPECVISEDAYLSSLKKILVDPFFPGSRVRLSALCHHREQSNLHGQSCTLRQ